MSELIAPITEDLRKEDRRMDIIKGMEHLNLVDVAAVSAVKTAGFEAGDWLVKGANGLEAPTATAVANTYPVWVGNDQLDATATGKGTIIVSGGFIYRTNKYVAGVYTAGQNLTIMAAGIPEAAGGGDPVLARVFTAPDAQGVMEIEVLNR
jgi:hypothetical protein